MSHESRATGHEPESGGEELDERSESEFVAPEKTPFSFKVMVVLGALYVAWRAVELLLCGAELIGWGSLGPDWCS